MGVAEEERNAEEGKTTDSLSVDFGGCGGGGVIGSPSIQLLDYLCSHVCHWELLIRERFELQPFIIPHSAFSKSEMSTVQSLWERGSNSVTDMFSNLIEIDIDLYKNSARMSALHLWIL